MKCGSGLVSSPAEFILLNETKKTLEPEKLISSLFVSYVSSGQKKTAYTERRVLHVRTALLPLTDRLPFRGMNPIVELGEA